MSLPKVVYDTMIFLQAAVNPQRRHATVQALEENRVILCVSGRTMEEVNDVLLRPALAAKFPELTPARVTEFTDTIAALSLRVDIVPNVFTWPQHPDDDHLFNLAIHVRADFFVTWESRILALPSTDAAAAKLLRELSPQLKIVTPAQFSEEMKNWKDN